MRKINYLVVHSSATPPKMDIGKHEITEWHKARRFRTIGYHFIIRRDGTLEYGRDIKETGAHVKGHNKDSIGICMVGGIDHDGKPEENFTTFQYQELAKLLHKLKGQFPSAIIQGHRDFKSAKTACPSFDVKAWWASVNNEEKQKWNFLTWLSGILTRFQRG